MAEVQGEPADPEGEAAGVARFMGAVTGWATWWLLSLGHRSGLLAAIRDGSGTAADVAARAGTHERSTREWLSGMTAAGFVSHCDGVFSMGEGQAALFRGGVLPFDPTVMFEFPDVLARVQPALLRSMADGSGVPYSSYQPEFSTAQTAMSAPLYDQFLVQEWVPAVEGLQERLSGGADVVAVGCGGGHALRLLAAAFPASRFTGYDLDEAALHLATERAAQLGLPNVEFVHRDVSDIGRERDVDVAFAVDAIHDQGAPRQVLASLARALRDDGVLVMVEPTATGDLDIDAGAAMAVLGYTTSLSHCIQVSLASGGPGLGGMWGSKGARLLLADAGFGQVHEHQSPSDYTVFAARR